LTLPGLGKMGIVTIERSRVERTIRRVFFVALKILPSGSRLTGGICPGTDVEAARSYESHGHVKAEHTFPETPAAAAALSVATRFYSPALLNHTVRSYLWGAMHGTGAFAEVWNGISWHLLKVPGPGSLVNGPGLAGVSCPLASRCVATGSYFVTASMRIVAEAWNGTSWRELRALNP
jgi:hypothetical protein